MNLKTLDGGMMMYKRLSMRRNNITKVYITTGVMKTYRSKSEGEIDEDVGHRIRAG
jgi:hypothetical protein